MMTLLALIQGALHAVVVVVVAAGPPPPPGLVLGYSRSTTQRLPLGPCCLVQEAGSESLRRASDGGPPRRSKEGDLAALPAASGRTLRGRRNNQRLRLLGCADAVADRHTAATGQGTAAGRQGWGLATEEPLDLMPLGQAGLRAAGTGRGTAGGREDRSWVKGEPLDPVLLQQVRSHRTASETGRETAAGRAGRSWATAEPLDLVLLRQAGLHVAGTAQGTVAGSADRNWATAEQLDLLLLMQDGQRTAATGQGIAAGRED